MDFVRVKADPTLPGRRPALGRALSCGAASIFALSLLGPPRPLSGQMPAGQQESAFAVIVHPSTVEDDLSLEDLRRVFRGEEQYWPNGERVTLFVQAAGTADGDVVLRELFQMNESEYHQYWIMKTFRGEAATGPKIVSSMAMARRLTARVPGAIAVVTLGEVDGTVKVLSVNHRLPGAEAYPLGAGRR